MSSMAVPSYSGRDDIRLSVRVDGEELSYFRLREFENRAGLVMVYATVLESLERVLRDLCTLAGECPRVAQHYRGDDHYERWRRHAGRE